MRIYLSQLFLILSLLSVNCQAAHNGELPTIVTIGGFNNKINQVQPSLRQFSNIAPQVLPASQCGIASSISVLPNVQTSLGGIAGIYTSFCGQMPNGSWTIDAQPKYGVVSFGEQSGVDGCADKCNGTTFTFDIVYYKWTSNDPNATKDSFTATWTNFAGSGSQSHTFNINRMAAPPSPSPENLGVPKNNCPCEGNPINPATGNKFQVETDYIGAATTGLEFRRFYNSQAISDKVSVGKNWTSTYHRGLTSSNNIVKVTAADGRVDTFSLLSGVWKANPDVTAKLTTVIDATNKQIGWKLTTEDDNTEAYDLNGRLLSITTRAGLITLLSYDAKNNLIKVIGPFGHVIIFTYDDAGRLTNLKAIQDKYGYFYVHGYEYNYDLNGNLISRVVKADGSVYTHQYIYENTTFVNALTGIIDENGKRFATYSYDDQGRAVSTEHAGGVDKVAVVYNADGSSTVTDARGNVHSYNFMTQFDLMKPTKVSGKPVQNIGGKAFSYDANGFLSRRTDWNGNITKFTHNSRGLETSRTEAFGTSQARTITTIWHTTYHLPTQISEPDRTTVLNYDAKGNLTKKTIKTGTQTRIWTYTYNSYGQVTSVDDPRTDVKDITQYGYDSQGNMISITDALGNVTDIGYANNDYDNGDGNPRTIIDPNGLTINIDYQWDGQVRSREIGSLINSYFYDDAGQLTETILPDRTYSSYVYDDAHRLIETVSKDLNFIGNGKIVYTLDANGNRTKEQVYDSSNKLVRTHSQSFDALNRLAKSINAQGQAFSYNYDNNGNLSGVADPLKNTSSQSYDALNRLIASIDPIGNETAIEYDNHDNPVKITDPRGAATTYNYDGLDNKTQTASPDTGKTQNSYDSAGNLITSIDARGKKTSYTYDALNRVTKISLAKGTPITFSYGTTPNAIGRLTQISDESGSTKWTYDINGQITSKSQIIGAVTKATNYTYNYGYGYGGKLIKMTYPSGRVINYSYDNNGKVSGLALGTVNLLNNIQYAPFAASPTSWTWGNKQNYSRTFDKNGRLIKYPLGERNRTLVYDAASRITDYTDSDPGKSQNFSYDPLSRLLAASIGAGSTQESLTYDTNSNRLSKTLQTTTTAQTTYTYGGTGNRLTQVTPPSKPAINYTYDAAGNALSDGVNTYAYSDRGRLSAVNGNQYAVNGLGQRVKKTTSQGTTLFAYDEAGHLIGEYDGAGGTIRETVYLGNTPVAVISGGVVSYIHTDHLNAPRAIVDGTGKTVWRWDSEPFGADKPNEDPDKDGKKVTYNLRFPGQYYDAESGLHYNYFRDYSPSLGRYIESDPIGLKGGLNTYGYVGGNPVSWVDLRGLDPNLTQVNVSDPLFKNSSSIVSPPDTFTILVHGSPLNVVDENGNILSPEQEFRIAKENGLTNKYKRIRLISCNTGVKPSLGFQSFAQRLASVAKMPVDAPNNFAWLNPDGSITVAPTNMPEVTWDNVTPTATATGPNLKEQGKFVTFTP